MITTPLLVKNRSKKSRSKYSVWENIHRPPATSPIKGRTKIFKKANKIGYHIWSATIIEHDTDDPEEIEIWKNILWYSIPSLWYGYPSRTMPVRYHILDHNIGKLCEFNFRKKTLTQIVPILSEILPLDIAKLIVEYITYNGIDPKYEEKYIQFYSQLCYLVEQIKDHNIKNFSDYYPFEGVNWGRSITSFFT